ncbi:MAG: hypothetical protein IIB39_06025 [Candidatus Marinimicrobia bacterium]|nr:hypothetical protein [Candidatus Neomarinimicrobiota bacterium]
MKTHVSLIILFILTQSAAAFPGEFPNERGIGLTLTDKGAGARYAYNWNLNRKSFIAMDIELILVNGPNEVPIVDPFTGITFKLFNENLLLFPVMIGYKRMLFVDQIVDNLRPYVQISAGPVMGFDMKDESDVNNNVGFIEQFSKGKAYYTIGAKFNLGANIQTSKGNFINASIGYSIIDFGKVLDNRVPFGGIALRVEIGKWIK